MNFDHYSITPPNPIIFRLENIPIFGNITLTWYGFLIGVGVALAVFASIREGKKRGIDGDLFFDLLLFGFPLSILGARLYFVIFSSQSFMWYLQNPIRIIATWEGGLAIHGGIIVAGLYSWWYLKRKKIPVLPFIDIIAVGFFIGQIVGRFGNFMNQEVHGHMINAPTLDAQREFLTSLFIPEFIVNGMFIHGNYYHPAFLYEALWNFAGLLIAAFILRRLSKVLIGEIAAFYAIWYSLGRIFIEALRIDNLMIGPLRVAQVISIGAIVVVTTLVIYRRVKEKEMIPYSTFNLIEWEQQQKKGKKKSKQNQNRKQQSKKHKHKK